MKRRILVIVNPHASAVSSAIKSLVIGGLRTRFEVVERSTEAAGHAEEIANDAAAQGIDAVVALGGDGTANEVANGLGGSTVPLICLPAGSASVFCGAIGVPRDLVLATRQLLDRADDWQVRNVDVGLVNGRRFLFNSGVGLDARVVEGVDARPDLKARWRQWWFMAQATRTLGREYTVKPPQVRIDHGQQTTIGIVAIVQNAQPWTYFGSHRISVSTTAGLDTGTLSATVVKRPRPWDVPTLALRAFSQRGVEGQSRVATVDATNFSVSAFETSTVALHVDGDHIGDVTKAHYSVDAGGLAIIV
ncbi:MAG: diacylglycerol kinase family protein [Actinomycetes bacterium]